MKLSESIRVAPTCIGLLVAATAGAFLAGGCSLPQPQPDLTRYYVLTAASAPAASAGEAPSEGPAVYIRSVNVPDYLRGRIMAVRLGSNEIRYVDDVRWAEPLEPGLARVLREDLERRGNVRVVLRPTDEHQFDIVVQVRSCEGVVPDHAGRLAAHVEIRTAATDPKAVAVDDFTTEVSGWDGRDYAQLAAKLSDAAGALAERIASLLPRKKA